MAGGIHKLKARTIETAKPKVIKGEKKPALYSDGGGLYLSVSKTGAKAWTYIWIRQGKRRQMGLGSLISVPVVEARTRAKAAREMVAQGKDPIKERDRKGQKTFGDCATELIGKLKPSWKGNKSLTQWTHTINVYCADLLSMDIQDVDTDDVLEILEDIWLTKSETARRVRSRIARIIDYATSKKWRKGDNPARWEYHLENMLPKQPKRGHFAALPYTQIPDLMEKIRAKQALSTIALEFTILTGMRTTEVLELVWSEIDFENKLWKAPAERMKGEVKHDVPLTTRMLEILKGQRELSNTGIVFHGQRRGEPLSNMAMLNMVKTLTDEKCTVHGMRSALRDFCGDMTGYPREVAEAVLAHKVGSRSEQSYRRGSALEKRRQLMQMWDNYCSGVNTSEVVQFHG